MDRTKRARATERTCVTKLIANLELELAKKPVSSDAIVSQLQVLGERVLKLAELDDEVLGLLLDGKEKTDDKLETESLTCVDYMQKATLVKVKADSALNPQARLGYQPDHSVHRSDTSITHKRRVRLPKIEPKKFSGELTEWLGWWAQFQKIDEDEEIHDSDKFSYLIQSMVSGSRAEEVIKRYPESSENYPKAILALKERFGKKKLLKQVYVRELIKMILDNRSKEKTSLSTLYDKLESSLRSLESLGVSMEQMVEFLFPMVESSLPEDTLLAWQRSPNFGRDGSKEDPPKSELDFLMSFLKVEIDNEQRKLARSGFGLNTAEKKKPNWRKRDNAEEAEVPTAAGLFSGTGNRRSECIFCDKGHESKECFKAQKMTLVEKKEKIKNKNACFLCLRVHDYRGCKAPVKCPVCDKKHLVLLCPDLDAKKKNSTEQKSEKTTLTNLNCTSDVLLSTLMVRLVNSTNNRSKVVRALLDTGSQRSYVLQKTFQELKLIPRESVEMTHLLFGGAEVVGHKHQVFNLKLENVSGKLFLPVTLMDQRQICGQVPRVSQGAWLSELGQRGIVISDINHRDSLEVEVLLGADFLGRVLTGKVLQLPNGLTATETKLGWTLLGAMERGGSLAMTAVSMSIYSSSVSQLWSLEAIGMRDPIETKSQEERERDAQEHFVNTVTRDPTGRYSVSLPWTSGTPSLPTNRAVSQKRLENITRKLISLGKFSAYDKVFKEWEAEGIISQVFDTTEEIEKCHFLPHRAVFKESLTTPVRPVFDASCKTGRNPSLNDCLEKGPNLLELIPSILLRFRMGKIGFIADIRKAFLMIEVHPEDRKFLQFLWWEDESQAKVKTYRHNHVVFGMNCSPFLLGAVIFHHLNQHKCNSRIIKMIEQSLYVDNLVLAVDTVSEFETVKELSTSLMSSAKI